MFDRTVDVNWGVRLANAPSIKFGGKITVSDQNRKLPAVRSNPGIPIGNNAMDIEDFDGSGNRQILVGTSRTVYLLAMSGTDYQQTWVYPFDAAPGATVSAVTSGDVDGDGHREIFFSAGSIIVPLNTYTVPYATSLFLEQSAFTRKNLVIGIAETSPNGQPSLLNVIDPSSGTVIWASPPLLGDIAHNSLGFYDLNADGQLEMTFGTAFGMYMTQ
jgi:FG-GAP-like repeat